MIKILSFILLLTIRHAHSDETEKPLEKSSTMGGRQKRLLFYDEEGSLVKTFSNPYLQDFALRADKIPFYGNFMNPFFAFIRTSYGGSSSAFTIPVSSEIVEKIQTNPEYQFKLAVEPNKEPVITPNTYCEGKRTQVPSPQRCNNFLNCWDGWSFEQECPEGLLFSREGYCDYSHNVDCNNREILTKPESPTPVQPQPTIPTKPQSPPQSQPPSTPSQPQLPDVPQPKPSIPTKPQIPPQSQPPSTPSQTQLPDTPPPQVPCLVQTSPTPQPTLADPKPQDNQPQLPAEYIYRCTEQYKTYRSPHNCKEFYICVDGKLDKYVCMGDLVYSQDAGLCFPRGIVDCGSTPTDDTLTKPYSLNNNFKLDYVKIN